MLPTPEPAPGFWDNLETFVRAHPVVIDRPRGAAHPRHPDFIYPLDYGYLADTRASDGSGVDVWVGSLPEGRVTGLVCTEDLLKRDLELKVLIACSVIERQTILRVHSQALQSALLIERPETV